jgi:hypothetical protein
MSSILFITDFFIIKHKMEKRANGINEFILKGNSSHLEVWAHDRLSATKILSKSINMGFYQPSPEP